MAQQGMDEASLAEYIGKWDKDFEKTYHDVETNHWWFKSRRAYLLDLINKLKFHHY